MVEVEELQEEQGARGSDGRQVTARELKRAQASEVSVAAVLVPEAKDADEERRSATSRGERKSEAKARRRRVPTPGEKSQPFSKRPSVVTASTSSSSSASSVSMVVAAPSGGAVKATTFAAAASQIVPEVAPSSHEHYMCIARGGVAFRRSVASSRGTVLGQHTGLNVNETVPAKIVSNLSSDNEYNDGAVHVTPDSTGNWLEVMTVHDGSKHEPISSNYRFLPLRNDVGEPLFVELRRAQAIIDASKVFVAARLKESEAESTSEAGPCILTGVALVKIQENPNNPLFRNLLLHRAKFQAIWQYPQARALLEAVGFKELHSPQAAPMPSPETLPTSELSKSVAPHVQPIAPILKSKAVLAVGPLEDGAVVYALRVIDEFNGDPQLPKVSRSAQGIIDAAAPTTDSTNHPNSTVHNGSNSRSSSGNVSKSIEVPSAASEISLRTKNDVCKLLDNGSWFDASFIARGGAFSEVWKFWVGGDDDNVEGPAWLTTVHKSELETRVKWGEGKGAKFDRGQQRNEKRKLKKTPKSKKQVRVDRSSADSTASLEASSTLGAAPPSASANMPQAVPSIRSEGVTDGGVPMRKRPRARMGSVKLGSHSSTEDSSSSSSDDDMPRVSKLASPPRKRKNKVNNPLTSVIPASKPTEKEAANKATVDDSVDLVSSDDNEDGILSSIYFVA